MNNRDRDVDIYNRILKYPVFSLQRRRDKGYDKTIQLDNATIRVTCFQTVNSDDRELLFVLAYLFTIAEKNNATTVNADETQITAEFFTRDISLLLRSNNYEHFEECLHRLTSLTIFYSDEKKEKPLRLLHDYKINKETHTITVHFDYDFYKRCKEGGITVSLDKLLQLSPVGQSLYCVFIANSNIYKEETLIERTGISASRYDKSQETLKRAFKEIKEKHIIKDFVRCKERGRWVYKITKY